MTNLQPASPRTFTPARIALGRSGSAIPTAAQLQFQLDHARARDAVHATPDFAGLLASLRERNREALLLESAIPRGSEGEAARSLYLRRPDLGRKLSDQSAHQLKQQPATQPDLAIIIADGLSALAIDRHALPLLDELLTLLPQDAWTLAPICLVRNARVAIADEIGSLLHAKLSLILIGERPGLSSPDSLGAYLTWDPRPGRTDAERNCISNIRDQGLACDEAARRISFYLNAARRLGGSGFALKEPPSPNLIAIS